MQSACKVKRNHHGHFASDVVREPSPENAASAVGDATERQRGNDGGGGNRHSFGDWSRLRGDHQPPTEVRTKAT